MKYYKTAVFGLWTGMEVKVRRSMANASRSLPRSPRKGFIILFTVGVAQETKCRRKRCPYVRLDWRNWSTSEIWWINSVTVNANVRNAIPASCLGLYGFLRSVLPGKISNTKIWYCTNALRNFIRIISHRTVIISFFSNVCSPYWNTGYHTEYFLSLATLIPTMNPLDQFYFLLLF